MRIATIFVRYGEQKYPDALRELDKLYAEGLADVERDLVIVDNAQEPSFRRELADNALVIGGDNSAWEFSAWDRGVAHFGDRIFEYDYVNLVTSAFRELYNSYLERFSSSILRAYMGKPITLGHIDCYNAPVYLGYYDFQHWTRSSCVFVSPHDLRLLGSLVTVPFSSEGYFSDNPEVPFALEAPLSENYKEYILGWLTGAGTGQGVEWHSKMVLNKGNFSFFKSKAMAILNEHMLSCRLRATGCRMQDITWVSSFFEKGGDGKAPIPDVATPWRKQIAERRWDPVVV